MHTKTELTALLREHGIRLSKRLGQHYLVDPNMCRKLVSLCELSPGDTVIEIGPGLGALTDLLAARCQRLIAVEVDRGVSRLLTDRMAHLPNVEVRHQDILEFPWDAHAGAKVVGAIPYHITSEILVALCGHAQYISAAWLGMQQEVAQRLSVLVQYRFAVTVLAKMPRGTFFPAPDVDSTWLRLEPHRQPPVAVEDEALFFEVVKSAFAQRRKTLANCLMALSRTMTRAQVLAWLGAAGLPPGVRGEELSLAQFAALANHLYTR